MLAGRNVALGVTGSIAAVKGVELAHDLRRHGAAVRAITTPASAGIIHPWSLAFATDQPVVSEITGKVEHIALCGKEGWADVLLIAPATANTIGKMAAAIDDTPVTTCATTALGAGCPVVVAPAMHEPMWEHPGILEAIDQLESWGVTFAEPRIEEGKAKIPHEETLVVEAARATGDRPLADTSVVITSGATREPVDAVRVLTNRASGKMGRSLARACYAAGASVTVIHDGPDLPFADVIAIETAEELRDAAIASVADADVFISAAAISDFKIESSPDKLDSGEIHNITLTPAPKVLDAVREVAPDLTIVGFKAEADASRNFLQEQAQSLLERVGATLVVANPVSTMGAHRASTLFVDATGAESIEGTKADIAKRVVTHLKESRGTTA